MKTIPIVDGASNCAYDCFEAAEKDIYRNFPIS